MDDDESWFLIVKKTFNDSPSGGHSEKVDDSYLLVDTGGSKIRDLRHGGVFTRSAVGWSACFRSWTGIIYTDALSLGVYSTGFEALALNSAGWLLIPLLWTSKSQKQIVDPKWATAGITDAMTHNLA